MRIVKIGESIDMASPAPNGICFQTIIPRQMILGTGIGDTAAGAYAMAQDITPEEFVMRFGTPMPPSSWRTPETPNAFERRDGAS